MNGRPLYRYIYHHDTLFTYDLKDSIYSFKAHPSSASNALSLYTKQIEQFVKAYLKKTGRLNDTVIGHSKCFALFVRQYDTVVNNNHNFTYKYICNPPLVRTGV
ncbi:hypothetical protein LLH06_03435 [Mucilaginibacter daejeonensis]|uniref:hypothetical protein n=1 Tax=Mucilaginibacter daejeonensis TaxID=398049 RepID=UPI001D1714E9|nr:hypothetical protein [Mucilaginibacter daejeonensis]UEG54025.1 hypothetical protein LLH06_03435 [Mucilaginibacter daejeonensis]